MRKHLIITVLLLSLAIVSYSLPQKYFQAWRLSCYSLVLASQGRPPPPLHPAQRSQAQEIERLRQLCKLKDGEIASLKRRLHQLAQVREYVPHLRFQTATAIQLQQTPWSDILILDRGSRDRVQLGDGVLQGQVLIGQITQMAPRTSLVQLITHTGSIIPVRVGESRDLCALHGIGFGQAEVVFYNIGVKAEAGATVITSGLNGQMPANLMVGTLTASPQEGPQPNTLVAPIELDARFQNLEQLLIVQRKMPTHPQSMEER